MENVVKTLKVTGMGCEGCASRVRKALEAIPGVESVSVVLKEKKAEVTLAPGAEVADETFKAAVAGSGKYAVESVG